MNNTDESPISCFATSKEMTVLKRPLTHEGFPHKTIIPQVGTSKVLCIRAALESLNQVCHTLDARSARTPDTAINLATMHRVKGVEFDAIFLASANKGLVPLDFVVNSAADAVTRRQLEDEERALVYVSLTRARKLAYVFAVGEIGSWFAE